jgi:hypothetical protein
MILYYAVGGGLGHLTRGRRVLESLGLRDAAIVTASRFADDARVCGTTPVIRVPQRLEGDRLALRAWLRDVVRDAGADRLIADSFPGGIQGELCGLDIPIDVVGRLLRWDRYREAVPFELPEIETLFVVEELTHALPAKNVVSLDLTPPRVQPREEEPYWLVVHSGPADEVRELGDYAKEMRALAKVKPDRIVVASDAEVYPASTLFPAAAKIFSAAGFNVMLETWQWSGKHEVLPFARRFDDQFLRAARRKRLSSANAPGPAAEM